MAAGIDWSVPVLIEAAEDGGLRIAIPEKLARTLTLRADDVLCFTGFENGTVEVWSVKKGEYSSLDDAGAAEQAIGRARQGLEKDP